MASTKDKIKIVGKSTEELLLIREKAADCGLSADDLEVIQTGLDLILWLPKLLLEQIVTLSRLMELLFRKSQATQSKRKASRNQNTNNIELDIASNEKPEPSAANENVIDDVDSKPSNKKSGRTGQIEYTNAIEHTVSHTNLKAGLPCPIECGGQLYDFRPSTRVIIKGSQMGTPHRYTIEKLRCALCNEIFTPDLPDELKQGKYDPNFIAQLALQKYYLGMPSLRQATDHKLLDFPLAHTTQWMLVEKLTSILIPTFNKLCMQASNATQVASISELKKNPSKLINESDGSPVAILNHNTAAAYLVPVELFEKMIEMLDERELEEIV